MKKFPLVFFILLLFGCSYHQTEKPVPKKPKTLEQIRLEQQKIHFSTTYFLMAEAALENNDLEQAIQLYIFADRENQDNFIIKETLLELLDYLCTMDEKFNEVIIEFSETFYPQGTYNSHILIFVARAYSRAGQYEKMQELMTQVLELEKSRRNYVMYYTLKQEYFEEKDASLLLKALELVPKEGDDNITKTLLLQLRDSAPEKAQELLQAEYERTNEEEDLIRLLEFHESSSDVEEITDLLTQHIEKFPDASVSLKEYFILHLFWQQNFEAILEKEELCREVGTIGTLKPLFLAVFQKEDYEKSAEIGTLVMKATDFDAEKESAFFSYLTEVYFYLNDEFSYFLILDKVKNDQHILRSYISIYNNREENPEERQRLLDWIDRATKQADNAQKCLLAAIMLHGYNGNIDTMNGYLEKISYAQLSEEDIDVIVLAYIEFAKNLEKAKEIISYTEDELPPEENIFYYIQAVDNQELVLDLIVQELESQAKPSSGSFQIAANMIENQGELEVLFQVLERAVELYPDDATLLNYLGYSIALYERENEYEHAEVLLTKALSLMPDDLAISDSLAWLYFKLGRYEEAKKIMEQFPMEDILYSEIAYHVGKIYFQLNQKEAATDYFQKAVQLDNDEKYVNFSKEILSKIKP